MVAKFKEDSYERSLHKTHAVLSNHLSRGKKFVPFDSCNLQLVAVFSFGLGFSVQLVDSKVVGFRRFASLSQKSYFSLQGLYEKIKRIVELLIHGSSFLTWEVIFPEEDAGEVPRNLASRLNPKGVNRETKTRRSDFLWPCMK